MAIYLHKPVPVEAVQFTQKDSYGQNLLAKWCEGTLRGVHQDNPQKRFIELNSFNNEIKAFWGDWIIKTARGDYLVYDNEEFQHEFELDE